MLSPFRKMECDFSLWHQDRKYLDAFRRIRQSLCDNVVLTHVDYEAASVPYESLRPLEMFIDASDYGWAA